MIHLNLCMNDVMIQIKNTCFLVFFLSGYLVSHAYRMLKYFSNASEV